MLASDVARGSGRPDSGMSDRGGVVPAEGSAGPAAAEASQNSAAQGGARERKSPPGHQHGQPEAQQQQQPAWTAYVATAARWMLIYWVVTSFFGSSNKNKPLSVVTNPNATAAADPPTAALSRVTAAAPIWRFGTPMALSVYLSEDDAPVSFAESARIWHQPSLKLGDWEDERRSQVRISLSRAVNADNATLWAHIYLTKDGESPDPTSFKFSGEDMVYVKASLINLRPKTKAVAFKKLVGGGGQLDEKPVEDDTVIGRALPGELVPFLVRNLTINIVTTEETIPMQQVIPQIRELVPLDKRSMELQKGIALFRPPVYVNDFWFLEENLIQVNSSLKTADLQLYLYPLSLLKFQVYVQMHDQMSRQSEAMGAGQMDEMKRMMLETNPWLLGLTFVVSVLHSIFDFLAFKNDINFWKGKKDITGLSVRSMLLDLFMQTVVFLYLLDNSANTSWVILFSAGIGLVIEAWKVKKAMNYVVIPAPPGSWIPYRVKIEDKESYVESQTKEYDEEAFRYLSYVAYPLMAGYAVYSLLYEEHKSWYSYVLNTVVGFCYMFGFLRMTPQLFVNYKLKSVAHMPWRTMVYKSLNTFIDDLFAFIIKAPLLHRIACFRDDVVFLVYLYQKWIYRVDPTRANEFGQVGVPNGEERATAANPEVATTIEPKKEK